MLHRTTNAILLLFCLFNATVAAFALPLDLRLIQMVPPESQVIASMLRPTPEGQPSGGFLLITIYNRMDLEDFFALTGADASRLIHQVVFVAAAGGDGKLSEHSLLISGHFNRDAILRSAEKGNATTGSYGGQSILVVPPLARERDRLNHVRWLAILNSDIAIFGTPVSVQHELDRQVANSRPDPNLMERLSRLGRDDETWFLLPGSSPSGIIESLLEKLDPQLGAIAREGGSIQFGIHIGRRVEITATSNIAVRRSSNSENDRPAAQLTPAHSFLAGSQVGEDGGGKIAVVKISRRRYGEWLAKFSKGSLSFGGTPPH